jgi:hypothetical protein
MGLELGDTLHLVTKRLSLDANHLAKKVEVVTKALRVGKLFSESLNYLSGKQRWDFVWLSSLENMTARRSFLDNRRILERSEGTTIFLTDGGIFEERVVEGRKAITSLENCYITHFGFVDFSPRTHK